MNERGAVKVIVAVLVIVGLLLAGNAIRNEAWTQGYTMGLLTSGSDDADLTPYLLYRTGPGLGRDVGFFGGVARLLFVALLAAGVLRWFGSGYRRRHGGQPPWARAHGPWCTEPTQTDADGADAPSDSTDAPQRPAPVSG